MEGLTEIFNEARWTRRGLLSCVDGDITQCRKQHIGLTEGINALSLTHSLVCRILISELIYTGLVGRIDPPLVEEAEEDDVVAQGHESMLQRHLHEEHEDIVYEGVEQLEHEGSDR